MKSQAKIRITGGELKGREILSPRSGLTHPMGAREKLALFNMINREITGAKVLDAYAGSGALGIEALSRGAESAVFVEKDAEVAKVLKQNLRYLGLENTEVKIETVGKYVSGGKGTEDEADRVDRKSGGERIAGGQRETKKDRRDREAEENRENRKKVGIGNGAKFDVILADPPYDDFDITEVVKLVNLLSESGVLVLSHPEDAKALTGIELLKSRKYAGARISVYRRELLRRENGHL